MTHADLLQRIAATLRADVGPAIDDEYAKTQAFMASVVLQKVARELESADAHRSANAADYRELLRDLETSLHAVDVPPSVADALQRYRSSPVPEALSELIAALYAARAALGVGFDPLLSRVRRTLRAVLDRRLESAK